MRARIVVRLILAMMTVGVLWNLSAAASPRRPARTSAGCSAP